MSKVTHEVLRQLRAQGILIDIWYNITVHMLHERLDPDTSRQFTELKRETEAPTVKAILVFFE